MEKTAMAAHQRGEMKTVILTLLLIVGSPIGGLTRETNVVNEIRTYMPFTVPIDPAKILILPDMDLSYALAATLVEWGPTKQPAAGLAKRWDILEDRIYRFTLRDGLKWSNGDLIIASQIKESLERGFEVHPVELRSLKQMLETIRCPSPNTIEFVLNISAKDSGLLGKLTEPNYGVLKIKTGGELDLSQTTGAFYVEKSSAKDIILRKNKFWHSASTQVAERVEIRQPPSFDMDTQTILISDKWPNLIQTSSLLPKELLSKYKADKFEVWERPTDRIFVFQLSPRLFNSDGQNLFRFLSNNLKKASLLEGFSGFQVADQLFPKGYHLHDPDFKKVKTTAVLPEIFKKRPIEILFSPARVSEKLRQNISAAVTEATGIKPKFISIPMQDFLKQYKAADYDFYAGTLGLADPDPEGAMSFYFESDIKAIPSIGEDYIKRLDVVRKEPDAQKRVGLMRKMLSEGTNAGNILPIFNLSTVGLARAEIDLSTVPTTDESVTLSRVRFNNSRSKD
jgi:MarR-like DNA-binding transcriptional regulator SgrR of sgrS sRNA